MKWILLILIPLVSGCNTTKHWSEVEWNSAPTRVPIAKSPNFRKLEPITFLNSNTIWYTPGLDWVHTHPPSDR